MTRSKRIRRGLLREGVVEGRLEEMGRTKLWLAGELGVDASTLFRWLSRRTACEDERAAQLARLVGLGIGDVLDAHELHLRHGTLSSATVGEVAATDSDAVGAVLAWLAAGHRAAVSAWPLNGSVAELAVAASRALTLGLRFSGGPAGTIMVAVVSEVARRSLTLPRVEHAEIGLSPPSMWVHRLGPEQQVLRFCVPANGEILVHAPAEPHARTVLAYSSAFEVELTGRVKHSTDQPHFALAAGLVAS